MIIKVYQTLEDRNNIEYIETNGPFKCERPDACLGHGYMMLSKRVQVCVIDLETVFIPPLKVIYPKKM